MQTTSLTKPVTRAAGVREKDGGVMSCEPPVKAAYWPPEVAAAAAAAVTPGAARAWHADVPAGQLEATRAKMLRNILHLEIPANFAMHSDNGI